MNSAQRNNLYSISEERNQSTAEEEMCARAVLRDLFELLETYAPVWYTEEHHIQASQALKLSA